MPSEVNFDTVEQSSADDLIAEASSEKLSNEGEGRWSRRFKRLRRRVFAFLLIVTAVFFVWVFRHRMFITVNSGEVILIYYRFWGGTKHNQVNYEGLHVIAPWDRSFRYTTRTQALTIPMSVLSRNGLEIHLDAQVRFHVVPDTVPYMHRRYGPNYIHTLIVPQLTEAVQKIIGQYTPEELYSSENGAFINRIFEATKRPVGGLFIEMEDIALLNIRIPRKVQEAVQAKAEAEQKALAQVYVVQQEELEAQRKLIEAKSLEQYRETVKGIPNSVLVWKGIEATLELAKSPNSKVIVIGSKDNLPLIMGNVPDGAAK